MLGVIPSLATKNFVFHIYCIISYSSYAPLLSCLVLINLARSEVIQRRFASKLIKLYKIEYKISHYQKSYWYILQYVSRISVLILRKNNHDLINIHVRACVSFFKLPIFSFYWIEVVNFEISRKFVDISYNPISEPNYYQFLIKTVCSYLSLVNCRKFPIFSSKKNSYFHIYSNISYSPYHRLSSCLTLFNAGVFIPIQCGGGQIWSPAKLPILNLERSTLHFSSQSLISSSFHLAHSSKK